MKNRIASALSFTFLALAALPAVAQNQAWIRQLGTTSYDDAVAAAPDGSGGVYVSGGTFGSLGGPNADPTGNTRDAWLARYDSAGSQTWIRQLGTSGDDNAYAAATDGSGGVYVSGSTSGSLAGPNAGGWDAWLAHYDSAGNQTWTRQFGTSTHDSTRAVAPDGSGGAYVSGFSHGSLGGPNAGNEDAWLTHYDSAGNQAWIRQLGTSEHDGAYAAAPDGWGGVYVGGSTNGSLGGQSACGFTDAWLARYDSVGNQIWIRQLGGTSPCGDSGVTAATLDGSGGVYVSGYTWCALGGPLVGGWDIWLARYDSAGTQSWIRQFGTSSEEWTNAAGPDGSGGVYVSGGTFGSLGGPNADPTGNTRDAWLARYDSAGNQTWIRQFGTSSEEWPSAVASDGLGGVYVSGCTDGSLGGPNAGGWDAWLARYDAPCGTGLSYCTAGTTSNGCTALILATGTASATAGSGFTLTVVDVEANQSGIIFYGVNGAMAAPWGTSTSFLCVKSPLERGPVQNSGVNGGVCSGVLSIDWNHHIATHPNAIGNPFVGGETVWAQGWFRDPPSPKATNLSNGLQFSVCP